MSPLTTGRALIKGAAQAAGPGPPAIERKSSALEEKNEEAERDIEQPQARKVELEAMMADPDLYGDQTLEPGPTRIRPVQRHLQAGLPEMGRGPAGHRGY